MPPDYPAAHSMDTQWFAVDADGHVAFAETGESGCAPAGAEQPWIADVLARIRGVALSDGFADEIGNNLRDEAVKSGLFVYELQLDYSPFESPYRLNATPENPIHVDQLPPAVREDVKRVRLNKVRFPEASLLQLVEHVPCVTWGSSAVYLASDGVTLRAIPGHEAEFDAAVQEMMGYDPDLLTRYRVERPDEGCNLKGI
jgi:hypothetical protein